MKEERIAQLMDSLSSHLVDDETKAKVKQVEALFKGAGEAIADLLPDNRDASIFITHFEDAKTRAVRSLTVPQ